MKKNVRKKNSSTTPMNLLIEMINEEIRVVKGVILVHKVMKKALISLSLMNLYF